MEEEEALRKHCRAVIVRVRDKRRQTESSDVGKRRRHRYKEGRGRATSEPERQVVAGDEFADQRESNLPLRERVQTSPSLTCQGPEVQPVPLQLMSMLKLKTVQEQMRRAAEVELHDPTACSQCEEEQASVALKTFIRRKKTQLQLQTLKGGLNTHFGRTKPSEFTEAD